MRDDKTSLEMKDTMYGLLNKLDDRRDHMDAIMSRGPHEPVSAYGGLYDLDEVDDGGRLVERHERGINGVFVPVAELPDVFREPDASDDEDIAVEVAPPRRSQDLRVTAAHPAVFIRRRVA